MREIFHKERSNERMILTHRVICQYKEENMIALSRETSLQEWAQMLEQLLEVARTQGYLTYSDILEALPQPEHHVA